MTDDVKKIEETMKKMGAPDLSDDYMRARITMAVLYGAVAVGVWCGRSSPLPTWKLALGCAALAMIDLARLALRMRAWKRWIRGSKP